MRDDRPIFAVFCVLIFIIGYLYTECLRYKEAAGQPPVRDTVTVRDTVPFYNPKPRDSVVIRYDTIKTHPLPPPSMEGGVDSLAFIKSSIEGGFRRVLGSDSAVILPITSHTYEGDGWRAHVSGFSPRLDSLLIFPERQTITIRDPPATGGASSRWTLGVQAGYGITPRGMQPYLGVGLTWHFKLF